MHKSLANVAVAVVVVAPVAVAALRNRNAIVKVYEPRATIAGG